MKDKNYEEMVRRAKEAVNGLDDPLKSIAFREVLNDMMKETMESPKTTKPVQPEVEEEEDKTGEFLRSRNIQTLNQIDRLLKPQSHVDKVLMFAYFLREARGLKLFQKKDIQAAYHEALLKPSTNTSQMINQNKKKGLFMDMKDEDDKLWKSITVEGMEEIERRISEALGEGNE